MTRNIGKKLININENPYLIPILFELILNEKPTVSNIAYTLDKAQSTVSLQLKTLKKYNYVLKNNNSYVVNHHKLNEEFIKYVDRVKYSNTSYKYFSDEAREAFIENKYLSNLIEQHMTFTLKSDLNETFKELFELLKIIDIEKFIYTEKNQTINELSNYKLKKLNKNSTNLSSPLLQSKMIYSSYLDNFTDLVKAIYIKNIIFDEKSTEDSAEFVFFSRYIIYQFIKKDIKKKLEISRICEKIMDTLEEDILSYQKNDD